MSGLAALEDALDARLKTLAAFDAANCAWPNAPYTPKPGTPYLAVQLVGVTRTISTLGSTPIYYWNGTYQVSAFYPAGKGRRPTSARIDQILDLFKAGDAYAAPPLLTPGVRISAASPVPSAQADGQWFQGIARISFFAHELQT
jgi:hypothetical protein